MTQPPNAQTGPHDQPDNGDEGFGVRSGDVIADKYEVLERLGAGGMGAVFKARHQTIHKLVAIKILRSDLAGDKQQVARFLQEARAANEVTHRNIVEVLDFGQHGGRPYLVMEFLRGEPLSALLDRERRLPPATIIRFVAPVLRALAAAHARGVIHRDIKPENIFLARDDDGDEPTPKVLDFGIAKRVVGDDVRLTDTRAAFGTPAYMAPEQAMGARDVTPAADQYAVGVMLYEALSGRLPHEGNSYNGVIVAKVTTPPLNLAEVCPDLDPALVQVVMRALAREPSERFADVAALREALEPFAGITSLPPVTSMPPRRGVDPRTPGFEPTVPDPRSNPHAIAETAGAWSKPAIPSVRPQRGRLWTVFAGVAVVAIGVFVALRMTHSPTHPTMTAAASTNANVHASAAGNPPANANVTFHLAITPPESEITLDGVVVGHGVAEVVRPRDGSHHSLHASAAGYVDLDDQLTADSDARIERSLQPLPAAVRATQSEIAPPVPTTGHPEPAIHPHAPATTHTAPADPRHPRMDRDIQL